MSFDLNIEYMFRTYIKYLFSTIIILGLSFVTFSCTELHGEDFNHNGNSGNTNAGDREVADETRKVLLLYSAGFNSLSSFLKEDFMDLQNGYLPGNRRNDDVMLVYSHLTSKNGNYSVLTSPVLMKLTKADDGEVMTDTLVVYEPGTISSSAQQLNEVLSYVKDEFPAKSYGMVFSSHATGYLPAGYYTGSKDYEAEKMLLERFNADFGAPRPVPYIEPEYEPSLPMTKSIGQDQHSTSSGRVSYEIELADFAAAIPMKMDYILFDACLMGGVEVAYQLRDVCGKVGFSQAEVLAEGLDYKTLTKHLLMPPIPRPEKVCEDYFLQYDAQSGVHRSATISLVACGKMQKLADVCAGLFEKHAEAIAAVDPSRVQRFYRYSYHWFYDLESILAVAGVGKEDLDLLRSALDQCVLYKASTPSFMQEFDINVFCGMSMFLPCNGGDKLKEYYKSLDWNEATGLVR